MVKINTQMVMRRRRQIAVILILDETDVSVDVVRVFVKTWCVSGKDKP